MSALLGEAGLTSALRRGLEAIRARHVPEVQVLAVRDNSAYLALGKMLLPEGLYTVAEVEVFVRAPTTFPDALPYGVLTRPALQRSDGRPLEAAHQHHAFCQQLAEVLGAPAGEFLFFSWEWKEMPKRAPEDLAHIVEWARKRVRMGTPS